MGSCRRTKTEGSEGRRRGRRKGQLSFFLSGALPILSFASKGMCENVEIELEAIRTYPFPFKLSFEQDRLRPRDDESSESDGAHSERSDLERSSREREQRYQYGRNRETEKVRMSSPWIPESSYEKGRGGGEDGRLRAFSFSSFRKVLLRELVPNDIWPPSCFFLRSTRT